MNLHQKSALSNERRDFSLASNVCKSNVHHNRAAGAEEGGSLTDVIFEHAKLHCNCVLGIEVLILFHGGF